MAAVGASDFESLQYWIIDRVTARRCSGYEPSEIVQTGVSHRDWGIVPMFNMEMFEVGHWGD